MIQTFCLNIRRLFFEEDSTVFSTIIVDNSFEVYLHVMMRAGKSHLGLLGDSRCRQNQVFASNDAGHASPGDGNN